MRTLPARLVARGKASHRWADQSEAAKLSIDGRSGMATFVDEGLRHEGSALLQGRRENKGRLRAHGEHCQL